MLNAYFRRILQTIPPPRPILSNRVRILRFSSAAKEPENEYGFSVDDPKVKVYLENLRKEFYDNRIKISTGSVNDNDVNILNRMRNLASIVSTFEERNAVMRNLHSLKDLENEKDEDMINLVKEEKEVYSDMVKKLESSILEQLLNFDQSEHCSSILIEVNAGVGGQEAMLFAAELFEMYCNFINYKNWNYELVSADYTEIKGLRHGCIIVYSSDAFQYLKHEAGVHRVQRVPVTEKSGRMHTSTVSVAVIPRTDDVNIVLHDKDLRIETKKASGAGGQHVNTTESAVRITHLPTGVMVEAQDDRSQVKNRETAMKRLKARLWQKEYENQEATKRATRKSQVGSSTRNEKIRTYNFTQDRITDHRLKEGTFKNLKGFLAGEESLEYLMEQLKKAENIEKFVQIISTENDS